MCEVHGPWIRGSGIGVGLSMSAEILCNSSLLGPINPKSNYTDMMRNSASSNFKTFMAPGSVVLVLRQGSNDYIE